MSQRYDKLVSNRSKVIAGDNSRENTKLEDYVDQEPPKRGIGRGSNEKTAESKPDFVMPIVETAYADREHFAEKSVTSSDGLMLIRIKQVKKIKCKDSNEVEEKKKVFDIEFKEKPAPTQPEPPPEPAP